MNLVLSIYPLCSTYIDNLVHHFGSDFQTLSILELRRMPGREILRKVRSLDPPIVFIPLEDEQGVVYLPFLQIVAAMTSSKRIEIIHPDGSCRKMNRLAIAFDIFCFFTTSIRLLLVFLGIVFDLKRLRRKSIKVPEPVKSAEILYLNANLWIGVKAGGSIGHVAGVVNAMADRGYRVSYVSAGKNPMLTSAVNLFQVLPSRRFGFPFELNRYAFNNEIIDFTSKLCMHGGYSFIYQRMSIGNYSGVVLSRKFNLPLLLEYNGSEVWASSNWGVKPKLYKASIMAEEVCLKHAHMVVTVSEVLRDELLERGVAEKNIVCYPNCVDPAIFNPNRFNHEDMRRVRSNHGIPEDAFVGSFIGTFGQWHGVEILAQAIRHMVDSDRDWLIKNKCHFLLVGDGHNMALVRQILKDGRYAPFYTLTGLIPQNMAPVYLATSDVLFSPHVPNPDGSRFFGSPTKLFEYMAMGKAIIASDLDQIGTVLSRSRKAHDLPVNGPAGSERDISILCKPGDITELSISFKFLLENPKWRNLLGENARAEALSKYTWYHHVDAILEHYRKTLVAQEQPWQ